MGNRIYRSKNDRILGGVCGGIAESLNIDPTIIRLIWALAFFSGIGLFVYFLAWLIMPEKPNNYYPKQYNEDSYGVESKDSDFENSSFELNKNLIDQGNIIQGDDVTQNNHNTQFNNKNINSQINLNRTDKTSKVIGIGLIVIGGGYLFKKFINYMNFDDQFIISIVFVILGIYFISKKNK